jgi:hypothetical protein
MMFDVAEPNESQSTSRKAGETARTDTAGTGSAQDPEIIDAEVVEEYTRPAGTGSRDARSSGPEDDEEYQQFLEFQKFQEWKRQHDGGAGTAPGPTAEPERRSRRWWYYTRKILGFKPVRRLLYLIIVVLLILWAIDSNFSSGNDSSSHAPAPGNQDPGISPARSADPKLASVALYHYLASSSPETACKLFSTPGQQAFAGAIGAPDCPAAAQRVHSQVTNPTTYGNPGFAENSMQVVGDQALIDSCTMTVDGGPKLGKFRLARQYNGGWLIDRYAAPTC